MLDLNEEDLEKLPSNRKIMKFMNEVKKVNEDPEFFNYMTKEEDEEKRRTTEIKEAKKERNIEVAKDLLKLNTPLETIMIASKLSKEEILKLKNNM